MLSPDVEVEGFSAEEWMRLGQVLRAPGESSSAERASNTGGGVVAVTTAGKLRKLFSTREGRLELASQPWPLALDELAASHQARWAVELTTGSLERFADRFAERLRPADTYLSQILQLLLVLRELEQSGELRVWPWPISEWPIPTERACVRALDALCPTGRVALLGVFARGELYTAVAARRGARGIDAILGPGELRSTMGLLSGDWQRDYRFLAEAAERRLGPVGLGCFGELYTFQSLVNSPPGSWAQAVAAREIVVTPVTPGVAIPLGLDAGRAVWAQVRGIAERFGGSGFLGAASRFAPAFERGLPLFENDVKAWLGFDPLRLLSRLLSKV
ncbi:MAG TPA: hypothetical protein VG937_31755 [Polyangiaceae bacterium]|nr:hypothetical protein [Polyangiaceae bacterium]